MEVIEVVFLPVIFIAGFIGLLTWYQSLCRMQTEMQEGFRDYYQMIDAHEEMFAVTEELGYSVIDGLELQKQVFIDAEEADEEEDYSVEIAMCASRVAKIREIAEAYRTKELIRLSLRSKNFRLTFPADKTSTIDYRYLQN